MSPSFTRQSQGALLRKQSSSFRLSYKGLSPSMAELSRTFLLRRLETTLSHTPHLRQFIAGEFSLGFFLFARCYSGNPSWFLFLPLIGCFGSGGSRSSRSNSRSCWEVPFGYPRILDCVRLPEAYRSLPRPSSAPKPNHPPCSVVYQQYPVPQLESELCMASLP